MARILIVDDHAGDCSRLRAVLAKIPFAFYTADPVQPDAERLARAAGAELGFDTDRCDGLRVAGQLANVARYHHERIDGSGYPDGLAGEAIGIEARIVGVADVVESMASPRPYRPALGIEAALADRGTRPSR